MGGDVEFIGAKGLILMLNRRLGTTHSIPEHLQTCEFVGDDCDPMMDQFYESKDFDPDWAVLEN